MKKTVVFNEVSYDLYAPFDTKYPVELINESLECGIGFFVGSSADSVTVYMVKKGNAEKFISLVNQIISHIDENFDEEDCLDLNDPISLFEEPVCFAMLHQKLPDSEYDFFLTGFDVQNVIGESESNTHDSFAEFSVFVVSAGSSCGDIDLLQYASSFGKDSFDGDTGEFEEICPVINGPETVISEFCELCLAKFPKDNR